MKMVNLNERKNYYLVKMWLLVKQNKSQWITVIGNLLFGTFCLQSRMKTLVWFVYLSCFWSNRFFNPCIPFLYLKVHIFYQSYIKYVQILTLNRILFYHKKNATAMNRKPGASLHSSRGLDMYLSLLSFTFVVLLPMHKLVSYIKQHHGNCLSENLTTNLGKKKKMA